MEIRQSRKSRSSVTRVTEQWDQPAANEQGTPQGTPPRRKSRPRESMTKTTPEIWGPLLPTEMAPESEEEEEEVRTHAQPLAKPESCATIINCPLQPSTRRRRGPPPSCL